MQAMLRKGKKKLRNLPMRSYHEFAVRRDASGSVALNMTAYADRAEKPMLNRSPWSLISRCAIYPVLMFVASCGSPGELKTYPVTGTVLYNGEPLKGVDVAFHASDAKNAVGYPPHATTDAEGKFQMMTYRKDDGCPAGEFKVAFAFAVEVVGGDDGSDQTKKITFQVPVKYHKGETSGIVVTVKPETQTLEPFKLEGPAKPKGK